MLLFTYGTLKRNQCRNNVLKGMKFVGEAKTTEKLRMYHNHRGDYPCLQLDPNGYEVHGEVYEVPDNDPLWARLDAIEGVPNLYNRHKTVVSCNDELKEVTLYVFVQDVEPMVKSGMFVEMPVWPRVKRTCGTMSIEANK